MIFGEGLFVAEGMGKSAGAGLTTSLLSFPFCQPTCACAFAPPSTQVLDLGVTRMLVHQLVRVFPHVCKHHYPAAESTKAACRICNKRFEEMGRRSKASTLAPGYASPHHCLSLNVA